MKRNILFLFFAIGIIVFLNSCQKEYSFENPFITANARGSLTDTAGNCLPDSIHGTFYNGVTPGGDTAYVEIQVQVDSVGNYKIYSDLQNGFMFADSGVFTKTGINTVLLKPIGTPILQTPTNFMITFDSSVCYFTVSVEDSTGTGLGEHPWDNSSDTAWSFSLGSDSYNGPFDSAYLGIDSAGAIYLALYGSTAVTTDSSLFYLDILLPNGVIEPGTYNTNTGSHIFFDDQPKNDTFFVYYADKTATNANTEINITGYDSSTNIATGTFSGTAVDESGNLVTITNGRFKVKVQ